MRKLICCIFILNLCACQNDPAEKKDLTTVAKTDSVKPVETKGWDDTFRFKNLEAIISDTSYHHKWEDGSILLFFNDTLHYFFSGSCAYSFPLKIEGPKIIVNWTFIEDCTFDLGIKRTFGLDLKKVPKVGRPFMELSLANDSTLSAKYFFPEWIEKFNKFQKYQDSSVTLFPGSFRLINF